jgi:hypothetical protein
VPVGKIEAQRCLSSDPERVPHRELALPPQPVPERLALDVRHGEPEAAGRFARVVNRQDMGMLKASGELDLVLEALRAERCSELGVEDLERHQAFVLEIAGEVNRGHTPTTELALERVAVGQGSLKPFQGLGQRDLSEWGITRL